MMKKKSHGTSDAPVQNNLKYGCDVALADRICNFNRRFAEHAGVCVCACVCVFISQKTSEYQKERVLVVKMNYCYVERSQSLI